MKAGLKRFGLLLGVAACAAVSFGEARAAEELAAKVEQDKLVVTIDGKLFTQYKFAADLKKPYFWPLVGPLSGKSVTTESSEPYPHHNSLFFGCDRVNGGNYWQDVNARGQILSQGPKLVEAAGERVVFTDECLWRQPGQEPVIRDRRVVTFTAPNKTQRIIDFQVTLEPLVDIVIQKTNHSLFSARMMPELGVKGGGMLVNDEGKKGEEGTFGVASPWCDYSGKHHGAVEGLAIFQHPDNRWFPAKWFTRDYGFMSPTPMYWPENGRDIRLPRGKPLTLKYRVVVHAGDAKAADVAGLYKQYAPNAKAAVERAREAAGQAEAKQLLTNADGLFAQLEKYDYGQSRQAPIALERLVRDSHGAPAARGALEARFVKTLSGSATAAGKQFACQQLSLIGGAAAAPALGALLGDEKLGEDARFALQRIPAPEAGAALRAALEKTSGRQQIGVINALAERRDADAVSLLTKLAQGADDAAAEAALAALGRISGSDASLVLLGLKPSAELQTAWNDACLTCAHELFRTRNQPREAARIFGMIYDLSPDPLVRMAALSGMAEIPESIKYDSQLRDLMLAALVGDEARQRGVALEFACRSGDEQLVAALLKKAPEFSAGERLQLVEALARYKLKAGRPAVAAALADGNATLRLAGLRAVGALGDARDVSTLLAAAVEEGAAAPVAVGSLARLRAPGVDDALIASADRGEAPLRVAAIEALAARNSQAAAPALLRAAADADADVQKAAGKALATLAGDDDLPKLVALLVRSESATQRRTLEQTVVQVARRNVDEAARVRPALAGLKQAPAAAQVNLLGVLRRLGGAPALGAIRGALASGDAEVRKAAIVALADWESAAPLAELLALAKTDGDATNRILALRGAIRQVALPAERSAEETVKLLEQALVAAQRPEEQKAVLAVLPDFRCERAVRLAEAAAADSAVKAEAELALRRPKQARAWQFDFQPPDAPVMEGFVAVDQSLKYDDAKGYGWASSPLDMRDRAKGTALTRDFIFDTKPRVFRVKVPNGAYAVTVWLGDMQGSHDKMQVAVGGELKAPGVTNRAGEVVEVKFTVAVKGGVLDLEFKDGGGSNEHWCCVGVSVQ